MVDGITTNHDQALFVVAVVDDVIAVVFVCLFVRSFVCLFVGWLLLACGDYC